MRAAKASLYRKIRIKVGHDLGVHLVDFASNDTQENTRTELNRTSLTASFKKLFPAQSGGDGVVVGTSCLTHERARNILENQPPLRTRRNRGLPRPRPPRHQEESKIFLFTTSREHYRQTHYINPLSRSFRLSGSSVVLPALLVRKIHKI